MCLRDSNKHSKKFLCFKSQSFQSLKYNHFICRADSLRLLRDWNWQFTEPFTFLSTLCWKSSKYILFPGNETYKECFISILSTIFAKLELRLFKRCGQFFEWVHFSIYNRGQLNNREEWKKRGQTSKSSFWAKKETAFVFNL